MNALPFSIRRRSGRGAVLFELIIALTVFTLIAFSLMMALSTAFSVAKLRNQVDAATQGLENQLALLHSAQLFPEDKDLDDDGSGILYHRTIAPESVFDQKKQPLAGYLRVTISAKWSSGGQDYLRQVSELIYQP